MNLGAINWLAVLVCILVSLMVGSIWFGPKTFFPVWWKAIGMKETGGPGGASPALTWGLLIATSVIQAIFMALVVNGMGSAMGGVSLVSGATTGFLIWLGFVAPANLANKLFAGHLKAWAIEAGNHLITYVLFGAILGAWH